jgi:hypothetical protein
MVPSHRLDLPAIRRLVDPLRVERSFLGLQPSTLTGSVKGPYSKWWTLSAPPRPPSRCKRDALLNELKAHNWGGRRNLHPLMMRATTSRLVCFGFVHTWSPWSESNTRRGGTSSLHCHCATRANSVVLRCLRRIAHAVLFRAL